MVSTPCRRLLYGLALAVFVLGGGFAGMEAAEQRAFSAEETYVTNQLDDASCLVEWGVNDGVGLQPEMAVTGLSGGGLRVMVAVPYHVAEQDGNQTTVGDTASEAVYRVTPTETRRLSGDDISYC
jgi:hypothetical protein